MKLYQPVLGVQLFLKHCLYYRGYGNCYKGYNSCDRGYNSCYLRYNDFYGRYSNCAETNWLRCSGHVLRKYENVCPYLANFRCTEGRQPVTLSARSVRRWHMLSTMVLSSQACRPFCSLTRPTRRRILDWSRRSCVITQSEDGHWWKRMDLSSLLPAIRTESEITALAWSFKISNFFIVFL